MRTTHWRRILAFAMTMCMLVSMCPVSAFADETETGDTGSQTVNVALGTPETITVDGNLLEQTVTDETGKVTVTAALAEESLNGTPVTQVEDVEDGDYLIFAYHRSLANQTDSNLCYITNESNEAGTSLMRHSAEELAASGWKNAIWTVTKTEGGYTFADCDGKYLHIAQYSVTVGEDAQDLTLGIRANDEHENTEHLTIGDGTNCLNPQTGGIVNTWTVDNGASMDLYRVKTTFTITGVAAGETDVVIGGVTYHVVVTDPNAPVDPGECSHEYGDVTYVWTEQTSCTASHTCGKCQEPETATTENISSKVTQSADCSQNSITTYTATFTEEWAGTATTTVEGNDQNDEHSYKWTYVWEDDYSDCTANGVCSKCQHEMTEKAAKMQELVNNVADCTKNSKTTYYASFLNAPRATKVITGNDALGHENHYGYCIRCGAVDSTYTSTVAQQGTWGAVTWTLDNNGLLTINATNSSAYSATIDAFTAESTDAWRAYKDDVKAVRLGDTVATVGAYAFAGMTNLTTLIYQPTKLSKINQYAFAGCTSLNAVNITSKITEVGQYAFSGCTSLEKLTQVAPSNSRTLSNYAFYGCTALKEVELPKGVSASAHAFENCTGLTTVTYGADNTSYTVNEGTFAGCTSLTSINLPDSVTSIGASAFENCTGLKTFVISPKLTSIGANAFAGCTGLESASYDGTKVMWENFLPKIKEGNEPLIDHVALPTGVIASGTCGHQGNLDATLNSNITWSLDAEGVLTITSLDNNGNLYSQGWSNYNTGVKKVVLNGTVKTISTSVFSGCTSLEEITGMDTVTTIQNNAFYNCTSLKTIDLSTVTSIDSLAFSGSGLTSVTLPAGITLTDRCFYGCTALETVTIEGAISMNNATSGTAKNKGIFQNCTALKTVTIGEGCTEISKTAFSGCTALTTVSIPASMENLNGAFSTCKSIDTVNYAGTDEQWDAVQNKSGVDSIVHQGTCGETLKWKIDKNGALTIYGSGTMTDYDTAENLAPWAQYADEVLSITVAKGPESIGAYAFGSCTKAKGLTLSTTVAQIASTAFMGTESLGYFKIDTTDNEKAHYSIWEGCLYQATDDGKTLLSVPAAWNGSDNEYAPWYKATAIGDYALAGCKNLTDITIKSGITSIGAHAFDGCTGLTSITIPGKNLTLGDNVFANCTGLTTVRLTGSVTSVGNELLSGNDTAIIRYAGTTAAWTAALGENTISNKVICSDTIPDHKDVTVELEKDVTDTKTYTDTDGNFVGADTSALNTAIATVSMTGTDATYAAGDKVTELMSGQQYVLVNNRANKALTNEVASNPASAGATSGLTMTGTADSFTNAAIWTIKEVDGGYTMQDQNGNYLTISSKNASVGTTAATLTLTYVADSGIWTVAQGSVYLNHFGGEGAIGSGYAGGGTTDLGNQWYIYELNVTDPGSTEVTFTAVNPGETSVTIGYTTYTVTVTGEYTATITEKPVSVEAGKDLVVTDETGNYVNNVDESELDKTIATVTVAGTASDYTAGEAVTALTSGQKYLIKSVRHGGYMTTASETSDPTLPDYTATGLHLTELKGDGVGNDIWTITEANGGYYVQSADGKYVTISNHAASLTETATVLTVAYNAGGGYWTLMQNNCYLNHHGGTTNPNAAGWDGTEVGSDVTYNASTDGGSQFIIQAVNETTLSTTVTIHGVAAGTTSVTVGNTKYNITVLASQNVDVEVGKDTVVTDETGSHTADTTDLDESIATVTVSTTEGNYVLGETVTALEDGGHYLIVNTRAGKAVNNASATWNGHNGLGFSEKTVLDATTIWTAEQVEGGYALKDLSGRYMTAGDNTASMGDAANVLTVAYVDGNWRLSSGEFYLNDGGNQHTCAYFWGNEAGYTPSTDAGSQWTIYAVSSTTSSTTITFHGVAEGTTSVVVGNTKYNITVTATAVEHNYVNGFCTAHADDCEQPYQPATLNAEGVYEIGNAGQLYWFAEFVNSGNTTANAKLVANIVVNESVIVDGALVEDTASLRTWMPIGSYTSSKEYRYTGTFDGQDHTVSGLYFNKDSGPSREVKNHIGLIGCAGDDAVIKNVGVINSYLYAEQYVGAVLGEATAAKAKPVTVSGCWSDGNIIGAKYYGAGGVAGYVVNNVNFTNCRNSSTINSNGSSCGGIVGYVGYNSHVTYCTNTGNVSGQETIGGVVGAVSSNSTTAANDIAVRYCSNTGNITASGESAGGVVGSTNIIVKDCYNTGNVTGTTKVGGVAGNLSNKSGAVYTCYNTGAVSSSSSATSVGGIVGGQQISGWNTVSDCYYLEGVSGTGAATGDNLNPVSKTAEQFASGEVTYLLNGSTSQGDLVWKQNVDNGQTPDASPKFEGGIVYQVNAGYTNSHTCVFDQEVATAEHLATAATCQKAATYYKSCACGANGTETFESGDALGHHYVVTGEASWNEEYSSCTVSGKCDREGCEATTTATTINITRKQTKDPTCTETGIMTYTATFAEDWAGTQTKEDVLPTINHTFDQEVATAEHLATAATCQKVATYYKSCACGANGTETFESGDVNPDNHTGTLGEWEHNETNHWKEYSCCGAHAEEAVHKDEDGNYICDDCNYELPKADTVIRLEGKHRYDTAIKVANEMKEVLGVEKFNAIIVAYGFEYYDALAGSYLSAAKSAPILLSWGGTGKFEYLDTDNINYIKENLAEGGTVYLLGGEDVVPALYENELAGYSVTRLGGDNRFETNLMILNEVGVEAGSEILVCTATNFADCLSAAATGKPILLVWNERGALYGGQENFLNSLNNCTFTIIGGDSAVSDTFVEILSGYGKVDRVAGDNRLDTSVEVAKHYFPNANDAVLAYANDFPDGLCGGALAYAMKSPLILTNTRFADIAADYTGENGITSGVVLGSGSQIADTAVREIFTMAEDATITKK